MGTELTTYAKHPWHGGWDDFFYEHEDGKGVVTYITLGRVLHEAWDHETGYNMSLLSKGPGAYRDDEIHSEGSENCFTVILDCADVKPGLVKDLFKSKVEQLNAKFDRDFKVVMTEGNEEVLLHDDSEDGDN